MERQLLLLGPLVLVLASLSGALKVEMTELSTVYVPKYIDHLNQETYTLPYGIMRGIAFDRVDKVIYAVGEWKYSCFNVLAFIFFFSFLLLCVLFS